MPGTTIDLFFFMSQRAHTIGYKQGHIEDIQDVVGFLFQCLVDMIVHSYLSKNVSLISFQYHVRFKSHVNAPTRQHTSNAYPERVTALRNLYHVVAPLHHGSESLSNMITGRILMRN